MMVQEVDHGITKWSKIGLLFLAGWFASSGYHATLTASKAVKAVPVLQAQAGCEHYRAKVATTVAKQAMVSAYDLTAPVPSSKALPADHCPHPAPEVK